MLQSNPLKWQLLALVMRNGSGHRSYAILLFWITLYVFTLQNNCRSNLN
jgi:hypothetical protein